MGFANVYCGVAQRAMDLAVPGIKNKTSLGLTRSMAYHPEIQHAVAEMALALDPIGPHLDRIAEDWSNGVDHGATWPAKIVSAKYHAVEACWRIVDTAMEVSGGAGMFRANELERLFRDARCGRFHPANTFLVHEIVAKTPSGSTSVNSRVGASEAGQIEAMGEGESDSGGPGTHPYEFSKPSVLPMAGRGTIGGAAFASWFSDRFA